MRANIQTAVLTYGTVANAAEPLGYFVAPEALVIRSIELINTVAIAAHATTIVTVTATDRGTDATGTTEVASQTSDSDVSGYSAISAKVPWDVTVSTTTSALEVASGSVIEVLVNNDSGVSLTGVTVQINYDYGSGIGYA